MNSLTDKEINRASDGIDKALSTATRSNRGEVAFRILSVVRNLNDHIAFKIWKDVRPDQKMDINKVASKFGNVRPYQFIARFDHFLRASVSHFTPSEEGAERLMIKYYRYLLQLKKAVYDRYGILQGAPGVGKTFAARRLAWSMMGEKDDSRIEFVQFHQNYSYEDFVMGYKPVENNFELKYGIFYRFCQKAANQPDKKFFFIIDEINRGNMSKIFGELLMLIERDYRGIKATLAYNGLPFSVPKNLYIIGMMNTADRSLAMIDYALRRRFSFFEIEPGFDSEGFIHYQNGLNNETLNELVSKVKELNCEIVADKSLGKGFCIGHSYFCGKDELSENNLLNQILKTTVMLLLRHVRVDQAYKSRFEEGNVVLFKY